MELRFLGAAREVTGSCHLIRIGGHSVLIDCGLIQGSPKDEERNREPFPFDASRIDAVVLTHAHLDHSGRLPLLVKAGFRGPIYAHPATVDLCRIMLRDAAYLNEKDTQWNNRKRLRKGLAPQEPLYTTRDVTATMRRFNALAYGEEKEIVPAMRITLRDAGHIIGSCIVEAWLRENEQTRKLVFSGDLGHHGAPILRDPDVIRHADLVVLESTYGDRAHRSWDETHAELAAALNTASAQHGNVLVPAFAVGRTQELLYTFGRFYDDWNLKQWTIFLDSPMAIEATAVYLKHYNVYDAEAAAIRRQNGDPFTLPRLHYSRTAQQSMAINRIESGAIIIAGSGMCDGGRIKHHLKHNVWRENCHVLITGYQARGTPGRALVDGAPYVRLWGETVRVAAQVHTIGGLSAHADQRDLLQWYGHFEQRPRVALVHGENGAIEKLRELLRATGCTAMAPHSGAVLNLLDFTLRDGTPTTNQ
jgi:metallo-beta-lactamase family protein